MIWKMHQSRDESAAGGAGVETGDIPVQEPKTEPTAEEQLRAEIASQKAEIEQLQDRYLRKAAEFDNYRKRMEKDRSEAALLAKSSVLTELLPVADDCERALESLGDPARTVDGLERYREGVRLLYKQLQDTLQRIGVARIAAVGKAFDPHLHEAVTREVSESYPDGTVVTEIRGGYLYKDRLLRPAQVVVSVRPQAKDPSAS